MHRIAIITKPMPERQGVFERSWQDMFRQDKTVRESCEIRVFSASILPPVVDPAMSCECRTQEELEENQQRGWLAARDYARALRWASQTEGRAIVLEDDLLFARNWLQKALACAAAVAGTPWVLSLHHMYNDRAMPIVFRDTGLRASDRRILEPIDGKYYGNGSQAVVFYPQAAEALAEGFEQNLYAEDMGVWPYTDVAINKCHLDGRYKYFFVDGCLICHMNVVSTCWKERSARVSTTWRFQP